MERRRAAWASATRSRSARSGCGSSEGVDDGRWPPTWALPARRDSRGRGRGAASWLLARGRRGRRSLSAACRSASRAPAAPSSPIRAPSRSMRRPLLSRTWRWSSPGGGSTRSSCRRRPSSAASGCSSWSDCPRTWSSQDVGPCDARPRRRSSSPWLGVALTVATTVARSRSAPTAGCASTSTRGRPPAWSCSLSPSSSARDVNGSRLTLSIGPFSGQPSELLKVILVVFFAGYLAENRVAPRRRTGPRCRPAHAFRRSRTSLPMLAMLGARARDRRRPARPRRGAPLLRRLPGAALRRHRPPRSTSSSGSCCSSSGSSSCALLFPHVRAAGRRSGSTRGPTRSATGFQVIQALHAFARGGLLGTGLGAGLPEIAGRPADPGRPHRLPAGRPRRGARAGRGRWRSWAATS